MKDDDKPKEGSFLFLFCKIVAIGFTCFVSTPAFSSFFPDTFYGERVFILWLALWILGISAEMFRSLSKSNSIIQKFHKKRTNVRS